MFVKHYEKMKIQDELLVGKQISKIKKINTNEIIRLIEKDDYIEQFKMTYVK